MSHTNVTSQCHYVCHNVTYTLCSALEMIESEGDDMYSTDDEVEEDEDEEEEEKVSIAEN